jgi:hypothetical protein
MIFSENRCQWRKLASETVAASVDLADLDLNAAGLDGVNAHGGTLRMTRPRMSQRPRRRSMKPQAMPHHVRSKPRDETRNRDALPRV